MNNLKRIRKFSIGLIIPDLALAQSIRSTLLSIDPVSNVNTYPITSIDKFVIPEFVDHLLLLDIDMPEDLGFEIIEKIREKRPFQKIVFLTSKENLKIRQKTKRANANGLLSKHVYRYEMEEVVKTIIELGSIYFKNNISNKIIIDQSGSENKDILLNEIEYEILIKYRLAYIELSKLESVLKEEFSSNKKNEIINREMLLLSKELPISNRKYLAHLDRLQLKLNTLDRYSLAKKACDITQLKN